MEELERAYLSAVIDVTAADGSVVSIPADGTHRSGPVELPDGASSLHVVTAWNPRSRQLPRAENEERDRRLGGELVRAGMHVLPAVGRSPDGSWAEHSYAVLDGDEASVLDLASRYDQHAIYRITPTDVTVLWTRSRPEPGADASGPEAPGPEAPGPDALGAGGRGAPGG